MNKIVMVAVIILFCFGSEASAKQVYNPIERKWETIPDSSKWKLRYNSHTNKYSYQPVKARIRINSHNKSWDWDSGHGNED